MIRSLPLSGYLLQQNFGAAFRILPRYGSITLHHPCREGKSLPRHPQPIFNQKRAVFRMSKWPADRLPVWYDCI
jgi:hypothetical protein